MDQQATDNGTNGQDMIHSLEDSRIGAGNDAIPNDANDAGCDSSKPTIRVDQEIDAKQANQISVVETDGDVHGDIPSTRAGRLGEQAAACESKSEDPPVDQGEQQETGRTVDAGVEVVPNLVGGTQIICYTDAVNLSALDSYYQRPVTEIETMEDFDVSTIANDMTNMSISGANLPGIEYPMQTSTPPKDYYHEMLKRTNMSELDASTLPGTPRTLPGSPDFCRHLEAAEKGTYDTKSDSESPHNSRRRPVVAIVLFVFAAFLLVVIMFLCYMLYQIKAGTDASSKLSNQPIPTPHVTPIAPVPQPTPVPMVMRITPTPTVAPLAPTRTTPPTAPPLSESSNEPTIGITVGPSASPSMYSAVHKTREIILERSPDSADTLSDPKSNQYLALLWIAYDSKLDEYSAQKVVQRWVLAVLFLEVSGYEGPLADASLSSASNMWMSYTDECDWFTTSDHTFCDENGDVRSIYLHGLGLQGTIPTELSLLSDSLVKLNLKKNQISGEIPSELALLTRLDRLQLTSNELSGVIPTEITRLNKLEVLGLGGNDRLGGTLPTELGLLQSVFTLGVESCSFVGPIPSEIGNMTGLKFLAMTNNRLTGEIPDELSNLQLLTSFTAHRNALKGDIPKQVCKLDLLSTMQMDCDVVKCSCCTSCCHGCEKLRR